MNHWAEAILNQLRAKQVELQRQQEAVAAAIRILEEGYDLGPLDPPMPQVLMPRNGDRP